MAKKKEKIGKELKQLRYRFHLEFDELWKNGQMERSDAYKWLAKELGVSEGAAHASTFNRKMCYSAMEAVKRFKTSAK